MIIVDPECVRFVTCGMILWNVECSEVVESSFSFGARSDRVTEANENVDDLVYGLCDQVMCASARHPAWQGYVDAVGLEVAFFLGSEESFASLTDEG